MFYTFNPNQLFGHLLDIISINYKNLMTKLKMTWHLKLKQVLCRTFDL